jgi:uncharacterized membrane protein
MNDNQHQETESPPGITSTANIAGHPIHPALIPFPIAFLTGTLLSDIAYWQTGDAFWARASLWLVGAGLVAGLLAAAFGATDYFTIARAREHTAGKIHFIGNLTAIILAAINLFIRWGDPAGPILWWGLILSLVTAAILGVTGWYGGELAYRHKIGVAGHEG